jgi:hypothetical protein
MVQHTGQHPTNLRKQLRHEEKMQYSHLIYQLLLLQDLRDRFNSTHPGSEWSNRILSQ